MTRTDGRHSHAIADNWKVIAKGCNRMKKFAPLVFAVLSLSTAVVQAGEIGHFAPGVSHT